MMKVLRKIDDNKFAPRLDLESSAAWQVIKKGLEMDEDVDYNTALFIYCALNKPRV